MESDKLGSNPTQSLAGNLGQIIQSSRHMNEAILAPPNQPICYLNTSVNVTWSRRITRQALPEFLIGRIKWLLLGIFCFAKVDTENSSFCGLFHLLLTPTTLHVSIPCYFGEIFKWVGELYYCKINHYPQRSAGTKCLH